METVAIFANPIAGRGKGKRAAEELEKGLRRRGYDVEVFLKKGDSANFDPKGRNLAAAIVIGGDGTLRGVAQWAIDVVEGKDLESSGAAACPLLIVPMGTANLMGKHLGIDWTPEKLDEEVYQTLRERRIVELDVGRTNEGVFLLMVGIGFDAWVVHELDRVRKGPIDYTKYILPAVKAVTEYEFSSLRVVVDGKEVFKMAPALAMVGNVPEYGTGFPVLPMAKADDGLLDVCVMPCGSRRQLAELLLSVGSGDHVRREGVVYVRGKKIRVESPMPVPVQVDGEPAGKTPVDVDLMGGRIPFLVPARRE